jgi:hypothetical protein
MKFYTLRILTKLLQIKLKKEVALKNRRKKKFLTLATEQEGLNNKIFSHRTI